MHCGLCLSSCPTYLTSGLESRSPRGRLLIMDQIQNGNGEIDSDIIGHLDSCLDCRGCETVCPSGVEYHLALDETKINSNFNSKKSFISKILLFAIKYRFLLKLITWKFALLKFVGIFKFLSKLGLNIGFSGNSIPISINQSVKGGIHKTNLKSKGTIGLFTGCIMNEWFQKTHKSTINVLNKLGYDVLVPKQDICCGALHSHEGNKKTAKSLLENSEYEFKNCEIVIINSAGCSAEIKSKSENSNKYLDIVEFLAKEELEKINPINKKVVWDAPCHLSHAQKLVNEPQIIFNKIGIDPIIWQGQELCCGGAGNYTLKNPIESDEILNMKMEMLSKLDFDYLITSNPGCYLQLEKGRLQNNKNFKIIQLVEFIEELI